MKKAKEFKEAMLKIMGASKEEIEGIRKLEEQKDKIYSNDGLIKEMVNAIKKIQKDNDDGQDKFTFGIYLLSILLNEKKICLEKQQKE